MAVDKWHPLKDLESMRREMDRIWEEMLPSTRRAFYELPWVKGAVEKFVASPAIDVIDKENEVVVKADMPGVDKDDIEISLQENTLTIRGEVKAEDETKEENYYYSERNYSSFARTINIPTKVEAEKIKAGLKDGILTIHLPKAKELQPRKIKVEIA
jgi:HSP20 family protein